MLVMGGIIGAGIFLNPSIVAQRVGSAGLTVGVGGHGEYCERPEEIRPALERSFASGKPALINVKIRKDVGGMKGSVYV